MKRVYIKAYMNSNLGDDLFVHILCSRYPDAKFYVLGEHKHNKLSYSIPNLRYISYKEKSIINLLRKLFRVLKRDNKFEFLNWLCKYKVLISGSYFMEKVSTETKEEQDASFLNNNFSYLIGCNFGPYCSNAYFTKYDDMFSKVADICFRDRYSYNLFKHLGNVRCAPDIAFTYDRCKIIVPLVSDYILISIAKINKDGIDIELDDYVLALVKLISEILKRKQRVVLISFCKEQDKPVIDEIMKHFACSNDILIVHYPDIGIAEGMGYFFNASAVIATRYHAMILALLYKKRVHVISYSSKIDNVIDSIHLDIGKTTLDEMCNIDAAQILDSLLTEYSLEEQIAIDDLIVNAAKQFEKLDTIMN